MKSELKKEYQKQKKKEKIKNICKWVAVGIGWTALCSLFIGLVCVGVKGCSNKNKQSKNDVVVVNRQIDNCHKADMESNDNEYIFSFENPSPYTWDDIDHYYYGGIMASQNLLYDVDNARDYAGAIKIETDTYNDGQGDLDVYKLSYYLGPQRLIEQYDSRTLLLRVGYVDNNAHTKIVYFNSHKIFKFIPHIALYTDVESSIENDGEFTGDNMWGLFLGVNNIVPLNINFTFENQINRYGVLNLTNSEVIISDTTYVGKHICFTGLFSDMLGNQYKNILIEYKTGNNIGYVGVDGNKHIYDGLGLYYYGLYYRDMNNNDILVNKWVYENTSDGHYYTNKSEWLDFTYQNIVVDSFEDSTIIFPINNLTGINRLNVFNNNNGDVSINGNNGLINAFTLLRMAFQSIANILNITILPGITIGTFIFIPLVVMIVIFIVWLFKR